MRIVEERFDRVVELASDTPACADRFDLVFVLAVVLIPVLALAAGVLAVGGRVGDLRSCAQPKSVVGQIAATNSAAYGVELYRDP
ncbi:hypothetical protein HEP87_56825 [Streptomyces sp. S1D4-11]